jgi:hypothetical protein
MRIWAPIYLGRIGCVEHPLVTIGRVEEHDAGLACADTMTALSPQPTIKVRLSVLWPAKSLGATANCS